MDDHTRRYHKAVDNKNKECDETHNLPEIPETDGQSHMGFPALDESMVVGSNANEDSDDNGSSDPNISRALDNYISDDPSPTQAEFPTTADPAMPTSATLQVTPTPPGTHQ